MQVVALMPTQQQLRSDQPVGLSVRRSQGGNKPQSFLKAFIIVIELLLRNDAAKLQKNYE